MAELAAAEVVADVAEAVGEEALDVAVAARGLSPEAMKYLFLGLGVGLVGGGTIGYFVANKRLRAKYANIAEEEIDEMREHFRQRSIAREEKPDLADKAAEITAREGYDGPATPLIEGEQDEGIPPEEEELFEDESPDDNVGPPIVVKEATLDTTEVESVFDKDEPQEGGWDYEVEVARRRPEFPYVIHEDERNEKGYTSTTLTYYEGDDVLCDEDDKPIEDVDKVVGRANLDRFGDGTESPDVMFVRNDTLQLEVEVERDSRSYSEVVHGIKHSADPPRRRRARFDDEDPT